jgi:hypothetical protein
MADSDKASPEDAEVSQRSTTPDQVAGEHRFLSFQEVFEIAQTLGRAMERLDNQSHKIEQLDRTVQGLSEKVERISRDFAYIKKAWWVVLILIGIALKEAYDMVIRPMIE